MSTPRVIGKYYPPSSPNTEKVFYENDYLTHNQHPQSFSKFQGILRGASIYIGYDKLRFQISMIWRIITTAVKISLFAVSVYALVYNYSTLFLFATIAGFFNAITSERFIYWYFDYVSKRDEGVATNEDKRTYMTSNCCWFLFTVITFSCYLALIYQGEDDPTTKYIAYVVLGYMALEITLPIIIISFIRLYR